MLSSLNGFRNHFTKYMIPLVAIILVMFLSCCDGDKSSVPFSQRQGFIKEEKTFDATVFDRYDNPYSLKTLAGNVVIVVFSTTWCPNCPGALSSLGELSAILKKDGIKNVKVLALNVGEEDIDAIADHYRDNGIRDLDLYKSVTGDALNGIRGVPSCLIYDACGKYVWGYSGGDVDYTSAEFISFVKKLAKSPSKTS